MLLIDIQEIIDKEQKWRRRFVILKIAYNQVVIAGFIIEKCNAKYMGRKLLNG